MVEVNLKQYTHKSFTTAVKATARAEGNLREKYQSYGLFALAHCREHGDTSYLASLVNNMCGKHGERGWTSPYRKLMIKWIKMFAPVASVADKDVTMASGDTGLKFKKVPKMNLADTDVDGAAALPFHLINGGKDGVEEFNFFDLLKRALQQQEKVESGEKDVKAYRIIKPADRVMLDRMLASADTAEVVRVDDNETEGYEAAAG